MFTVRSIASKVVCIFCLYILLAHDGVKLNSYANLTAVVHAMDAVVSHQAKRNAQKCTCVTPQEETALTFFTLWALNEVL